MNIGFIFFSGFSSKNSLRQWNPIHTFHFINEWQTITIFYLLFNRRSCSTYLAGSGRTGKQERFTLSWWTWTWAFAPKLKKSRRKSCCSTISSTISNTTTGGPIAISSAKHWPSLTSSVSPLLLTYMLRLDTIINSKKIWNCKPTQMFFRII